MRAVHFFSKSSGEVLYLQCAEGDAVRFFAPTRGGPIPRF